MDAPNLNECYLYFALTGRGFDPDAISTALNLAPTRAVYEGNSIGMGGRISGYSSWQYGTPILRDGDVFRLNEIADELIVTLLPVQDKIAELIKAHRLEAYLMIVLTVSTDERDSTPAIGFSPQVISFCHAVGASIEFDIYQGQADEEEEADYRADNPPRVLH
ncbi:MULTISPECIES: DUF4279 domain-containing protein [Eikenella]|jgi:hypothetical protein|uniref:DUF4279 domain-containing protein n=2 Tax=Eikenella corrodens TaxID=539 RepID=V7IFL8_EIKCO|nr:MULTISPECIES: DUF4279 domain-containing protein [Eikenella]ETA84693.1 hypothetical protein HMPREF1177_00346 [Eikenella corrodens CC92I]MDN8580712.1 DUF4279 domain-containing protein [Eikenella corrodens]MDN8582248.1 DUF4279 domain-containing protein [Eikenella corrodens]MDU4300423.1 DUF4279 domain-containing protein [Eikenella corrodens]OAM17879.1 hypothetical protein A7P90_09280 [Eikenella corrodens]